MRRGNFFFLSSKRSNSVSGPDQNPIIMAQIKNMQDLNKFLQPTEYLDFNKKSVSNRAFEICNGLTTDKEKVIALFYWVRDKV